MTELREISSPSVVLFFFAGVSDHFIASHMLPAPNPPTIKNSLGHGSHMTQTSMKTSDKRPHFFTINVLLSIISSPNKNPILVSTNNSLSSVYLTIGLIVDDENKK